MKVSDFNSQTLLQQVSFFADGVKLSVEPKEEDEEDYDMDEVVRLDARASVYIGKKTPMATWEGKATYVVWEEVYIPGSRDEPGDSDTVEVIETPVQQIALEKAFGELVKERLSQLGDYLADCERDEAYWKEQE